MFVINKSGLRPSRLYTYTSKLHARIITLHCPKTKSIPSIISNFSIMHKTKTIFHLHILDHYFTIYIALKNCLTVRHARLGTLRRSVSKIWPSLVSKLQEMFYLFAVYFQVLIKCYIYSYMSIFI